MLSTSENEKEQLRRRILEFDGPRVLEIGAFKGETTRILAEAAAERGGTVVVIDPMRWAAEAVNNGIARHVGGLLFLRRAITALLGASSYEGAFWENVGEAKDHVRLYRCFSDDTALLGDADPVLAEFDVAFIDGDHSDQGALHDLRHWGTRVAAGGSIFVHDAVARFPGVLSALSTFEMERGLSVTYPSRDSLARIDVPWARTNQVQDALRQTA